MNSRKFVTICAFALLASAGYGQSAALTADAAAVTAGSTLTLTASINYPGAPSAVGWSITLPEGWMFVATSGPNAPQVGPESGATGTLEWAYADVPANGVRFSFTVKAAGKPGSALLSAKVILRANGKQQTVEVAPVSVSITP